MTKTLFYEKIHLNLKKMEDDFHLVNVGDKLKFIMFIPNKKHP